MKPSEDVFILLGSNIEPEKYLPAAVGKIRQHYSVLKMSRVYQSPAVGYPEQPDYLNMAVLIQSENRLEQIRKTLRGIEKSLGRTRQGDKFAPRTIDLDLIMIGSRQIDTPDLVLPDPDLLRYPHVAVPIAELSPDFIHPVTGEKLALIAARTRYETALKRRRDIEERIGSTVG